EFETEQWLYKGAKKLLPVSKVAIKGAHNIANAMATLAMGEVAGIPMHSMLDTLTVYKGLPHRMQWVTEYKGVNWFNDSKATNVGAAIAAINGVAANRIVLIAGGQGKDQNFEDLGKAMSDRVSTVVLIGEDAKDIAAVTPEGVEIIYASDMNDAVIKANAKAGKGDAVLLSPACASFDMFSGYEHRGEIFIESVRGLTQ
ncbi:MAG: UDP-N-acetylmuramoyl-L-alanine--D-glutamate ligase, partial [Gammaproteobacteria bacterium]|nr:UDP-N-acetylmuramoyl-L-alanine--D-glutamate ligase [Gammaproteobacteria bacterium]